MRDNTRGSALLFEAPAGWLRTKTCLSKNIHCMQECVCCKRIVEISVCVSKRHFECWYLKKKEKNDGDDNDKSGVLIIAGLDNSPL